ncbi:23S rRNA (pseudouridine(1915)-N(3))-methyltransferase RlmH [Gemella sanguinis]
MKVTLICVGKVKEKFYRDAIKEYEKRLGAYIKLNTIEINDEKVKVENDSEIELAMEKEGNNILSKIKYTQYVITLEILGKSISSEQFAAKIDNLMLTGKSDVVLVIGGSYGLSDSVKKRSDYALSFSKMTFPHQMMRVVLLEQVYRAYRIITGASYHK